MTEQSYCQARGVDASLPACDSQRVARRQNPSDNLSPLGALARFEPEKARAKITAAFVACDGVGVRAAKDLGLSYRNLMRLMAKLGCGAAIDAECEKRGFPRHAGRPREAGTTG